VASSAIDSAQNIGYVIPVLLVQNFFHEVMVTKGSWGGIPEPGLTYRLLESPPLREFLELPPQRTGVQITSVAPLGALGGSKQLLRCGEVLLKIDGQDISNEGTILLRLSSGQEVQLPFEHLITSKRRGESTSLSVLRPRAADAEIVVEFAPIPPFCHVLMATMQRPLISCLVALSSLGCPRLSTRSISWRRRWSWQSCQRR